MSTVLCSALHPVASLPAPLRTSLAALLGCLETLAQEARAQQRRALPLATPSLERKDLERLLQDLDAACLEQLEADPEMAEPVARLLASFPLLRDLGQHCLSLIWKAHQLEILLPPFLIGPLEALAVESSAMTLRALEALREGNEALAAAVVDQDDWVDGVHHQMRSRAIQLLLRDPSQALPTQALLDLAKHWEGLADSAVRLARTVSAFPPLA